MPVEVDRAEKTIPGEPVEKAVLIKRLVEMYGDRPPRRISHNGEETPNVIAYGCCPYCEKHGRQLGHQSCSPMSKEMVLAHQLGLVEVVNTRAGWLVSPCGALLKAFREKYPLMKRVEELAPFSWSEDDWGQP